MKTLVLIGLLAVCFLTATGCNGKSLAEILMDGGTQPGCHTTVDSDENGAARPDRSPVFAFSGPQVFPGTVPGTPAPNAS